MAYPAYRRLDVVYYRVMFDSGQLVIAAHERILAWISRGVFA
jgi:hypothetical protein